MTDNPKARAWRTAAKTLFDCSTWALRDPEYAPARKADWQHIRDAIVPSLRRRAEIIEGRKRRG